MAMSFALTGVNISYAAVLSYMPETNQIISTGTVYELPKLVGLKFTSDNPFEFTFMLSKGDMPLTHENLQREVDNIGKYFLAALTLPEDDLWVNLSPYEQDRISTNELAQTDLGKDMLGEDYVLKQLVSSVTYPESESGKKFWGDIYKKVKEKLGTINISVNTFNKVWIMPDKIRVVEADDRAAIDYAKLKVMMEGDYLALSNAKVQASSSKTQNKAIDAISDQTMRDVVIPIIEEEVNNGKHFARLRQIYSAIVMAVWFKKKLAKTILNEVYFDKKKIKGADVDDPQIRQKIYNEYTKAFREGVYNYLRRDRDPVNSFKIIKRRYVSGGIVAQVSGQTSFIPGSRGAVNLAAASKGTPAYADTRMDPAVAADTTASEPGIESTEQYKAWERDGHLDRHTTADGRVRYIAIRNPGLVAMHGRHFAMMSEIQPCDTPKEAYDQVVRWERQAREEAAMAPHPAFVAAQARAQGARAAREAEGQKREAERREQARVTKEKQLEAAKATAANRFDGIKRSLNLVIRAPGSPIQKISNEDGTASYRIIFNLNNGNQVSGRTMVSVSMAVFATPQDAARALLLAAASLDGYARLEFYHNNIGLRGTLQQINDALDLAAIVSDEDKFTKIKNIDTVVSVDRGNNVKTTFGIINPNGTIELSGKLHLNGYTTPPPHFEIVIRNNVAEGVDKYSFLRAEHVPDSDLIPLLTAINRLNALPRVKGDNPMGGIRRLVNGAKEGGLRILPSGSMTEMGEFDQRLSVDRQVERDRWREGMAQKWRDGDYGTVRQLPSRGDRLAITYILSNDMPVWLPADHFPVDGEIVYVVNTNIDPNIVNRIGLTTDAIIVDRALHEAQEHYRQQDYSERDAHILAWYDQLITTGGALTPQQRYELEQRRGEAGLYEQFAQSNRDYHYKLVRQAGGDTAYLDRNGQAILNFIGQSESSAVTQIGNQGTAAKPQNTGGLDFAATDKMENLVQGNGVQFSNDKTMAYLLNGKVAGFRLVTTKLTF